MKYLLILLGLVFTFNLVMADSFTPSTKVSKECAITTEVITPLTIDNPVVSEAGLVVVRGTTRNVTEGVTWEIEGAVDASIICNFTMPGTTNGVTLTGYWESGDYASNLPGALLTNVVLPLPATIAFNIDAITAATDATLGEVSIPITFTYEYSGL